MYQKLLTQYDLNPLQYGLWSAVYDMAWGPVEHPCEDYISENKDNSGGVITLLLCLSHQNQYSTLYTAQASCVAKLELAPALFLFKKVLFLLC